VRSLARGTKTRTSKRRGRIREPWYNREYERCVTEKILVYQRRLNEKERK
jgi:hypothetical protein